MAKQKKDLSLIVWVFGWLLTLVTMIKKAATKLQVPFEAFDRLGSPEGESTIEKIVQLIKDESMAQPQSGHSHLRVSRQTVQDSELKSESPPRRKHESMAVQPQSDLPPNHYRIRVNRGPFPSAEIRREHFSALKVPHEDSRTFDGKIKWTKHESRAGEEDVTGEEEVVILVKDFALEIKSGEIKFSNGFKSEDVIAWGLRHGYVPADVKEAYAVGIGPLTRHLQEEFWMVALGSFQDIVGRFGGRRVAVLSYSRGRDERDFRGGNFDTPWREDMRFLFVRRS